MFEEYWNQLSDEIVLLKGAGDDEDLVKNYLHGKNWNINLFRYLV